MPTPDVHAILDDRSLVWVPSADDAEVVFCGMRLSADRPGAQDHASVVPDPNPPPELDGVLETDPAGPLDPLVKQVEQERGVRNNLPAEPHPPVAEPMDRHGPKPLFKQVAVVGAGLP